jgi:prepilin-type N-terminal cleavage/methylation domain-containing protein
MNRGLTLIELLAVIAISLVLVGLISPIYGAAHLRALQSTDISNMRQLGIAAALYTDQTGHIPASTADLQAFGAGGVQISPLDGTQLGQANELLETLGKSSDLYSGRETSYRRSYIGFGDYGYSVHSFEKQFGGTQGEGWLVSLTTSTPFRNSNLYKFPQGDYLRLQMDGSVVSRKHRLDSVEGNPAWAVAFLFSDAKTHVDYP